MYRKERHYNSDVHIYEFDPRKERIDNDIGTFGKLEVLSKIGVPKPGERIACKINATFFDMKGTVEYLGTYVDEGKYYAPPHKDFLDVIFTKDYKLIIKQIPDLNEVAYWQKNAFWVIAGSFSLVLDGQIKLINTAPHPHANERHPRTAIGQKANGDIVLVVVQGRNILNKGVTATELASIMLSLGCVNAVNLDGGGSSEMIINDKIVNQPTDGKERAIGAALIVYRKDDKKMKVYISPSTQENNTGKGEYGTEEQRMNQVADVVVSLLQYNGIEVIRNKPDMSLMQVIEHSNSVGPDLHVAIHSNAMDTANAGKARGCEVWIYKGSVNGRKIAEAIYKELEPITPTADRGIKETTTLAEVAKTKAPSCIVEVGFHDNLEDAIWIMQNIALIGEAIAKGICNYAGIQFKKPITEIDWQAKYNSLINDIKVLLNKYEKGDE